MERFWLRILSLVMFAVLGITIASCSEYDTTPEEPLLADTGLGRKYVPAKNDSVEGVALKEAFFESDKSEITTEGAEALRYNANWLKAHPDADVQIEGHCDERGSFNYNLSLGERRAEAAKKYLIELGIPESKIFVVSYGANKGGQTTWAQNRNVSLLAIFPMAEEKN